MQHGVIAVAAAVDSLRDRYMVVTEVADNSRTTRYQLPVVVLFEVLIHLIRRDLARIVTVEHLSAALFARVAR